MRRLSLKSKILLSAFLLAAGAAVGHEIALMPTAQEGVYNWTSTSIAPSNPNSTYNGRTRSEAITRFGCENGAQTCATGTKVSGSGPDTDVLRHN